MAELSPKTTVSSEPASVSSEPKNPKEDDSSKQIFLKTKIKNLIKEATEIKSPADVLAFIPEVAAIVNAEKVPGNVKQALVITGLQTIIEILQENKKITDEIAEATKEFITTVAPIAIDAVVSVAKGKIQFQKPEDVIAAVETGCKLCMGFLAIFSKSKKSRTN